MDRFFNGDPVGEDEGGEASTEEDTTNEKGRRKMDKGKGKEKQLPIVTAMVENGTTTDSTPQLEGVSSAPSSSTHSSDGPSVSAVNAKIDAYSTILNSTSAPDTTPATAARITRLARKSDVIQRATARRKQLQEELDSVKVRLWECTIEEAVLINLRRGVNEERQGKV